MSEPRKENKLKESKNKLILEMIQLAYDIHKLEEINPIYHLEDFIDDETYIESLLITVKEMKQSKQKGKIEMKQSMRDMKELKKLDEIETRVNKLEEWKENGMIHECQRMITESLQTIQPIQVIKQEDDDTIDEVQEREKDEQKKKEWIRSDYFQVEVMKMVDENLNVKAFGENYTVVKAIANHLKTKPTHLILSLNENELKVGVTDFALRVNGRSNIAIIIEDMKENIFGCFIDKHIQINAWVNSDKCFVFRYRMNGNEREFIAFPIMINRSDKAIYVCRDDDNMMFAVGGGPEGNDIYFPRRSVHKRTHTKSAFEYNSENKHPLTDTYQFIPKRLTVVQFNEILSLESP